MSDEFLANVRKEGDPAFPAETENDNSAASPAEKTTDDQTPSPEGEQTPAENKVGSGESEHEKAIKNDRGYAERWSEFQGEWKNRFNDQEKRHSDEINKIRQEFEERFTPKSKIENSEVPSWFGGDKTAWDAYQGDLQKRFEDVEKRAVEKFTAKTQEEQRALDEATKYMNDEVATIESDKKLNPTEQKIDRNKLLKFVLDRNLVDTQGRWNYRAGYEWMSMLDQQGKPGTSKQERKAFAAATTDGGKTEHKNEEIATSETFKNPANRPW